MKRFLIVFLLTVFSVMAFSFEVPPLTGRVVDNAGIFTSDEIRLLDSKIQDFESSTGGQLVVAVLKQLDGTAIEEAGIQMADKWKIGKKDKDNGIILILSMEERAMRVEVGYGWEGCVTDARAGDVIRFMKPYFQKAQYFSGISGGIEKLQTYVTGISPDGETQMSSGEFDSFAEDYAGGVIPP